MSTSTTLPRQSQPQPHQPHRRIASVVACAALLLINGLAVPAQAADGPMDFVLQGLARPTRSAGQTGPVSWRMAEYSAIRLVDVEAGAAANELPQTLSTERVSAALTSLTTDDGREPLFNRDEIEQLAPTLVKVLQAARPDQDLLLMSSARRGRGLLTPQITVTARLFVHAQQLHLIVREDRIDVINPYRRTQMLPKFAFGSRTEAGTARLRAEGRAGVRADWISWPLAALQMNAPAAPALSTTLQAVPAVVPASLEERLRTLKRLHEQGLISDDDYTQRRRQILGEL